MFFKNIDSWGKARLSLVTALCGLMYVLCATAIPTIIISNQYDLTTNPDLKLSLAGIIVVVIIITVCIKAVLYVIGILPSIKRGQQVLKFGLGMFISLVAVGLVIWLTYIIESNLNAALFCIRGTCYSMMGAIVVDYTCLKTLQVQWMCENKVDEMIKLDNIKNSRKK